MMDDFIQVLRKKKPAVLNYLRESIMPDAKEVTNTENSSKNPSNIQASRGREPFITRFNRKRDTVVSAIRSNYKTSIFTLTIDQFTTVLFQNQFSPISRLFLFYKYCHTLIWLGALGVSLSHLQREDTTIEWHIFLEHWMSVVGSAEALIGVFTVTYFYHHCRTKAMRDSYHISEGLHIRLLIYAFINSTAITFICASTVIFWFFIYGKSSSTPISIEHIVLPALLLVKMNIENIPFTIDRFFYPVLLLTIYFINVIVHYYVYYRALFNSGKLRKTYIFIYFNDKSLLNFLWFVLESLLITVAVHIVLTLQWHSRWLIVHKCCPKRDLRSLQTSERHLSRDEARAEYMFREDFVEAIPDPNKTACKRCLERIADLERSYRHDFIHPEWKQKLRSRPSFMYVFYRTGHLIFHFLMLFISIFEPEKPLKKRPVKYFILWAFYFGNFFLCVSFIQSLCGFAVIVMAYTRRSSLKYYEKSELFVTGFQKFYAAINGCAVALATFTFVSSWVLEDDTKQKFASHDYTYDVPHVVNPLSMCLDFFVVGHPYKFIYFLLSFGILGMNIIFNYWLYHSKITGRTGEKLIYKYLNWDNPLRVSTHIAILYSMLVAIHLTLWVAFLTKRTMNVVFRRRQLYRPREQTFREDSDIILGNDARRSSPLAYDLSLTRTQAIESEPATAQQPLRNSASSTLYVSPSRKTMNSERKKSTSQSIQSKN